MNYIAYYRVSTQKQGSSGLGLDAQKSAVTKFINPELDSIILEFTDIESGKNDKRPQLAKAIEQAKQLGATLLIAKLDRLSRNAAFIFMLRDSKIDFVCADMPNANSVTIGIMAVLAQDERERISQRTKAALAELKKKGKSLGTPANLDDKAIQQGLAVRQQNAVRNENNRKATALIASMKKQGLSFYQITFELNKAGFKTRRGNQFHQAQVKRLYEREILHSLEKI
ncbi:MAG TPA: recombinase family protein [Flavipsychrobacter sp.]